MKKHKKRQNDRTTGEEGLASPHSIPVWEKNMLRFIGISLNQSQSPWAVLENSLGKELVLVEHVYTFKSCFNHATENSDWTDSLAICLDLPCRDLRSS